MSQTKDWTLTLQRLRRELGRDLEGLSGLLAVQESKEELDAALQDLDHQLARAKAAAVIVLVGSTGAGKSTTLNALAGRDVAREGETRPTTSVPTVYAPDDADLRSLLNNLGGPPPAVVRYAPNDAGPFTDQVLIDAPDVNSIASEHRETVRALADRADVLLVVLHRQSVVEDSAVTFLDSFAHKRRLIFALNRADELTPDAAQALLDQIGDLASRRLGIDDPPRFAISSRDAQAGRGGAPWAGLLAELERLVRAGSLASVRRHNAIGAAGEVARLVAGIQEKAKQDLVDLPRHVEEGLDELIALASDEVEVRLALRRSELANLLTAETGKRWDGPGGWSLRAGAWSTLGAGLGLAIARRNPLAAAGVMAGGAVVSKVRSERDRNTVADTVGLLPEEGELRGLYTKSFSEARLIGGRLCGDPEVVGVPGFQGLAMDLGAAVEEAWQHLLRRQLPETAERGAPWWVRWPLDLPVYAFAGWLLYRAGEGFIHEDYVGFDFLVNGLLLALAMVFLIRLVVRSSIAARAGGLVRRAVDRARVRLEQSREELAVPSRRRAAELSQGLERLAKLESRWAELLDRSSSAD